MRCHQKAEKRPPKAIAIVLLLKGEEQEVVLFMAHLDLLMGGFEIKAGASQTPLCVLWLGSQGQVDAMSRPRRSGRWRRG